MTPSHGLSSRSWLMSTKWVTIKAWIGTMKLARIIHQSSLRPGKLSCEIA